MPSSGGLLHSLQLPQVFASPSCAAVPPCHPCCDCTLRLECASACQHLFPHGDRCEARYLPGFHQGVEFAQPFPWPLMANLRGLVLGIGALGNNSVPCSVVETGRARFSSYGTLITSSVCLGARLCSAAAILRGMRCASLAASKTVVDLPVGQMVITPLVGGVASVFIPISPVFLLPYFSILTPAFSAVHF